MKGTVWSIGAIAKPAAGHSLGGDRAVVRETDDGLMLAVIDVLGHGPSAHEVAVIAEEALIRAPWSGAGELIQLLDRELAGTVGAAAGVATFEGRGTIGQFAAVGNTVFRLLGPNPRMLVSADGIVGQSLSAPKPASIHLQPDEAILMHSDGISSRVDWRSMPEITEVDAQFAATEIVRRFGRSHDDISCIIARPIR